MAASEGDEVVAVVALQGEAPKRNTVRGVQGRMEEEGIKSVEGGGEGQEAGRSAMMQRRARLFSFVPIRVDL